MPRRKRPQISGGYYHVIVRGVAGAHIFMDDPDRRRFVDLLLKTRNRRRWRVHAYCLMSTHVHLVIETTEPNVSRGLQWLFSVYAQTFNRRWGRFGHLFADRFWSRVVEDDDYFEALCRYVFENPVRAGLCDRAAEWRWNGGLVFSALTGATHAV